MKKIMFSDAFCLTKAVLGGTKTMTRRILHGTLFWERCPEGMWTDDEIKAWKKEVDQRLIDYSMTDEWPQMKIFAMKHLPYKVGEVVAIAQSYKTIYDELELQGNWVANEWWCSAWDIVGGGLDTSAGYRNKMFVKADFMIHHIRITDVKAERLQDISDDDIMREGVWQMGELFYVCKAVGEAPEVAFPTAREAFWFLIDKISGKGTWERNPWVVAYGFELVD